MTPFMMLIALVGAHMLFDYPLQGDFLSKAKNKFAPLPGVPWYQAMMAHVILHATAVALITGIWWLFIAEGVIHFATDYKKCEGKIDFDTDQMIHILCKVIWWIIAMYLGYRVL